MVWLNRSRAPFPNLQTKRETPDGIWMKCENCEELVYKDDFNSALNVCPKCKFHSYIDPKVRIASFLDKDSFKEFDHDLTSTDPLVFSDSKPYGQRLKALAAKTGDKDAFISGEGTLLGIKTQIGVFNFSFLGGSMGIVVGEKVARLFRRSMESRTPAIIFSASGGARMQEGILSLMQMAKTCAALGKLRSEGIPYVSILCHPTTGGVAASFAMLGDINIAEPQALIGFAGPRVIQQTIGEKLPVSFQRSEYLLEHGMLDMICQRHELRDTVGKLLKILVKNINSKSQKHATL